MSVPEIAIVVSPRPWAEDLHRFLADHGGARVRARILDAREALSEPFHVLVAEDLTSFLTPRLVDELHRNGRRVLGVFDDADGWGQRRLAELGVDEALHASEPPEVFLHAITALTATASLDVDAELDALVTAPAASPAHAAGDAAAGAGVPRRGLITAVVGASGGPGTTEVAIALAAALSDRGERAVLMDADVVAASLAQRLGLAPHPNVRSAIDALDHRAGDLAGALQPVAGSDLRVLVGLATPDDWEDLRPGELTDVAAELARSCQHLVVDAGHRLEDLGGFGGHGRYDAARAAVACADRVVVVAAPTPVGLARALHLIADLRTLTGVAPIVAFDRCGGQRGQRGQRGRGFERAELEEELRRTYSPEHLAFLPEDRRVSVAAWAGQVVRVGPFTRAVGELAARALPRVAAPARIRVAVA